MLDLRVDAWRAFQGAISILLRCGHFLGASVDDAPFVVARYVKESPITFCRVASVHVEGSAKNFVDGARRGQVVDERPGVSMGIVWVDFHLRANFPGRVHDFRILQFLIRVVAEESSCGTNKRRPSDRCATGCFFRYFRYFVELGQGSRSRYRRAQWQVLYPVEAGFQVPWLRFERYRRILSKRVRVGMFCSFVR